jgi:hypothetical protein
MTDAARDAAFAIRWDSADAYRAFRDRHRSEYERRSAESEPLYETERIVSGLERRG